MNPPMLQQANPPGVMGMSFTDSHLKDQHAVFVTDSYLKDQHAMFVQNEMVPLA